MRVEILQVLVRTMYRKLEDWDPASKLVDPGSTVSHRDNKEGSLDPSGPFLEGGVAMG